MGDAKAGAGRDRDDESSQNRIVRLSEENARWLEQQDSTADVQLTVRRLLDAYSDTVRFLTNWATTSETHRTLFYRLVADESGILLSDLQSEVDVSDRTLRTRLNELEEKGIIERAGYPQIVSVADDELYVIVCEVSRFV